MNRYGQRLDEETSDQIQQLMIASLQDRQPQVNPSGTKESYLFKNSIDLHPGSYYYVDQAGAVVTITALPRLIKVNVEL